MSSRSVAQHQPERSPAVQAGRLQQLACCASRRHGARQRRCVWLLLMVCKELVLEEQLAKEA